MTLFEELGVEYKEVDGILYPLLSVDETEYNLADIGKYGRLWLRYMEENEPSEYRHMARMGQLRKQAEAINEEAYERLDNIEETWLKKHMTGKKKTFMEQLYLRSIWGFPPVRVSQSFCRKTENCTPNWRNCS